MRRCMHCHTGDIRRVIRSARTCDNITGCCPITIQHMAGSYRPRTAFIYRRWVLVWFVCHMHACRDAAWDALSAGQARNLRPGMRVKLAGAVGRYLR